MATQELTDNNEKIWSNYYCNSLTANTITAKDINTTGNINVDNLETDTIVNKGTLTTDIEKADKYYYKVSPLIVITCTGGNPPAYDSSYEFNDTYDIQKVELSGITLPANSKKAFYFSWDGFPTNITNETITCEMSMSYVAGTGFMPMNISIGNMTDGSGVSFIKYKQVWITNISSTAFNSGIITLLIRRIKSI
tara:strand:+ start:243 stop:824 length:582 start_codon:yes stop_codon:yes gene_type:complete